MEEQLSFGDKLLEGFLRVLVFALIFILIAIPLCILLNKIGLIG
ncbi:hypothetical protein [Croceitalea sp. P059]|nr:hypothetical protein [Croceitalea sp. P059]MDT0539148.1 hypothetical protein [Croceitalea sp. P059]